MEFICPWCGLVVEAGVVRGLGLMKAHAQDAHGGVTFQPRNDEAFHKPMPVDELRDIAQTLATNHKWRSALTLEDAVFLHQLEIDPT